MSRLLVIVPLVVIALTVLSLVDLGTMDSRRVRGLPKWGWVLVILFLPIVGAALWFFVGRARQETDGDRVPRPMAPDDDPAFLGRINRDREQEERIRRLEQELSELDDDDPKN